MESNLDAMVDIPREQSCLGDGTSEDTFDHEEWEAELGGGGNLCIGKSWRGV